MHETAWIGGNKQSNINNYNCPKNWYEILIFSPYHFKRFSSCSSSQLLKFPVAQVPVAQVPSCSSSGCSSSGCSSSLVGQVPKISSSQLLKFRLLKFRLLKFLLLKFPSWSSSQNLKFAVAQVPVAQLRGCSTSRLLNFRLLNYLLLNYLLLNFPRPFLWFFQRKHALIWPYMIFHS